MIVLENEKYLIEVDEMGAELSRIYSKEKDLEYMWLGDEKYWLKHSPVLFPFIGRMMDQRYTYKGKSYGMSRHGFAPISVFSIQKLSDRLVCTLNAVDRDDFPFDCTLEISYILRCDGLDMVAKIINRSDEEMIYTYGGHPGFNVPLEKGLAFEDYYLYFPEADKKLYRKLFGPNFLDSETKEEFSLKDGRLDLAHGLFDDDASAEREKLLLGRLSNYIFDTSHFSLEVSDRAALLDRCAEDLANRESVLAKHKVGRKSKFDARKWYYDTYWKNAAKKPSYRELGAVIGISHMTVKRDLIELGYIGNDSVESDSLDRNKN